MHVIAAKAVAFREALTPDFKIYQKQIIENAKQLGEELLRRGFRLVSGGTDNHMVLIDLRSRGLTGKLAEETLDSAGITVNKNGIPFDTNKPTVTSGIRIGTPAVTTRGMKEKEMIQIAEFIDRALKLAGQRHDLETLREEVGHFCKSFPLHVPVRLSV